MKALALIAALALTGPGLPLVGAKDEPMFQAVGNTFYAPPGGDSMLAGSCVAIGKYWAIGVTHAGGQKLQLDGKFYNVVKQLRHPTADLSLFKLDQPVKYAAPIYYAPAEQLVGKGIKLVSCGVGGIEMKGQGHVITAGSEGTRRSGFNTVSGFGERSLNRGSQVLTSKVLLYDLGKGEAGMAPRDSGGGWFMVAGGNYRLIALCAYISRAPNGSQFDYGAGGAGIHLGAYKDWIESTVARN